MGVIWIFGVKIFFNFRLSEFVSWFGVCDFWFMIKVGLLVMVKIVMIELFLLKLCFIWSGFYGLCFFYFVKYMVNLFVLLRVDWFVFLGFEFLILCVSSFSVCLIVVLVWLLCFNVFSCMFILILCWMGLFIIIIGDVFIVVVIILWMLNLFVYIVLMVVMRIGMYFGLYFVMMVLMVIFLIVIFFMFGGMCVMMFWLLWGELLSMCIMCFGVGGIKGRLFENFWLNINLNILLDGVILIFWVWMGLFFVFVCNLLVMRGLIDLDL